MYMNVVKNKKILKLKFDCDTPKYPQFKSQSFEYHPQISLLSQSFFLLFTLFILFFEDLKSNFLILIL